MINRLVVTVVVDEGPSCCMLEVASQVEVIVLGEWALVALATVLTIYAGLVYPLQTLYPASKRCQNVEKSPVNAHSLVEWVVVDGPDSAEASVDVVELLRYPAAQH
jgi:hypothetical protein